MRFLAELKRRKVIQTAVIYAVASWALLQVAELLLDMLEVPAWGLKLVFVLLADRLPARAAAVVDAPGHAAGTPARSRIACARAEPAAAATRRWTVPRLARRAWRPCARCGSAADGPFDRRVCRSPT